MPSVTATEKRAAQQQDELDEPLAQVAGLSSRQPLAYDVVRHRG